MKLNFKKVLTNAAIVGGTGAISQVLATVIEGDVDATTGRPANAEIVDYGMIAAGIILPEVIKNDMVDSASSALLAVGAYRLATAHNLAKMVGVNGLDMVPGRSTVGSGWMPGRTVKADQPSGSKKSSAASSTVG